MTTDTTTTKTQEVETMTQEYWTLIGGQPRTSHATMTDAVDTMLRSLGETAWACTVGPGGTEEVVDGEHAEMLAHGEDGAVVLGYRSEERAQSDRDGAYPDGCVERVTV